MSRRGETPTPTPVADVNKWIASEPAQDYAGYLVNSEGKVFQVKDGMRSASLIYKTDGTFVIGANGHMMPEDPGLGYITVTCDASSGNSFTFEYNDESYEFVDGQPNGFDVPTIEF